MERPSYHALGSQPTTPSADVIVIFRSDATEKDVRTALKSANASIVGGPTAADAYLLHVPTGQRKQSIARLQDNNNVQMAQPIDGTPR
jgi:hypothetical protein